MDRIGPAQALLPSVLDRLIDARPEVDAEAPADRFHSVARIKEAVMRDLEWLFNSRRLIDASAGGQAGLRQSPLTYGLPDLTTISLGDDDDRRRLRRTVEEMLEQFEPRLDGVVVTVDESLEGDLILKFRIDARLRVEPAPEPVAFDSVLMLSTKAFEVRDA